MIPESLFDVKSDDYCIRNASKAYKKGNYQLALVFLDELIRRDPFNSDHLILRAKTYLKLNQQEEACKDIIWLTRFLNNEITDNELKLICK